MRNKVAKALRRKAEATENLEQEVRYDKEMVKRVIVKDSMGNPHVEERWLVTLNKDCVRYAYQQLKKTR